MRMDALAVTRHEAFSGAYRIITFDAPAIAAEAMPGQFVHVQIPQLDEAALRRPFSIYKADGGELAVLYKPVGRGTEKMASTRVGDRVSVIGPLGQGFPALSDDAMPVLVAGGYGVAPLSFFAERSARKGIVFVGGRTAEDILCIEDFQRLGWTVHVSTEDGSAGTRGRVTDVLDAWLDASRDPEDARRVTECDGAGARSPEFYACGPEGMLRAVSDRAAAHAWPAWISLDNHMGCGVGACLVCVQKVRAADGTIQWQRACREGPVFCSTHLVWDDV